MYNFMYKTQMYKMYKMYKTQMYKTQITFSHLLTQNSLSWKEWKV